MLRTIDFEKVGTAVLTVQKGFASQLCFFDLHVICYSIMQLALVLYLT